MQAFWKPMKNLSKIGIAMAWIVTALAFSTIMALHATILQAYSLLKASSSKSACYMLCVPVHFIFGIFDEQQGLCMSSPLLKACMFTVSFFH